MSFSPFDPEVMRVTLGRNRNTTSGRSDLDRIAENASFEDARLKSAYREIEKRLADLLSLDFVQNDPEALDRLHQLFFALDIEDFSKRFDHFADYALTRLEAIGTDDDAGAQARARLRAGLGRISKSAAVASAAALQSPLTLMTEPATKSAEPEPSGPTDPGAPRPRMRLRL